MSEKICAEPGCTEQNPQPLENFRPAPGRHGGGDARRNTCKTCQARQQRERRALNSARPTPVLPPPWLTGEQPAPPVLPRRIAQGLLPDAPPAPATAPPLTAFARQLQETAAKQAAAAAAKVDAARQRLESDTATLKPGDLTPDQYAAPGYDAEKKQEYSAAMGAFKDVLRAVATGAPVAEAELQAAAQFVSFTAEQERRWIGKRLARSVSIASARETLMVRQFEATAARVVWPVKPEGYATRTKDTVASRGLVLMLSDLHIGANLPSYENPVAFNFLAASRRLARLAFECGDYKTQYRPQTELVIAILGDIIEGLLGWNDADNAPFAEQQVACCFMLAQLIEYLAARFPRVRVVCETGNHGRNKLTHPGRATSSKWNSQEFVIYKFLQQQCRALKNVAFEIPLGPNAVVDLLGKRGVFSHGDTEHNLKSPGKHADTWRAAIEKLNSTGTCGGPVDLFGAGHFHEGMLIPCDRDAIAVANAALVPSNGHSRSSGYGSICGQWLWEFTARWVFGDNRFLRVGTRDDSDSSLDQIIAPFESDRPAGERP